MKNDTETSPQSAEEIVEQIARLMAEAEAKILGPAADEAGEKLNNLRRRFEDIQLKAANAYGTAREKVVQGARATDQTIRSHPYESLAVALGVGVLLGALLRRNND